MPSKPDPSALEIAQRLIARRDHSCRELAEKLKVRGVAPPAIEQTIEQCLHYGWLNDQRFAENYIRYRSRNGFGPIRILAELSQRGVAQSMIPDLNNVEDVDWFELAAEVARKKYRQACGEKAQWQKQARFLQGRGFAIEHIRYALNDASDPV